MEKRLMYLKLVRPSCEYAEQVMQYKEDMLANNDSVDGCAGLEEVNSFTEWIDFENRLKRKYGEGYVPSEVFLGVRIEDDKVVGIIDYRHPLTPFLLKYGGNIGYSILPSERHKGYASEMLKLLLEICREFGEKKVLLTCDKTNEASRKTITARPFFEHRGYRVIREQTVIRNGIPLTNFIMEKKDSSF